MAAGSGHIQQVFTLMMWIALTVSFEKGLELPSLLAPRRFSKQPQLELAQAKLTSFEASQR